MKEICDKKMTFNECELAILRAAVDKSEERQGKRVVIINGKIIVDQGQLVSMDMQHLLSKHRAMTADLMGKA